MRSAWPFRVFIAAVIVALTVPRLAQVGMFGDGLLYAVVARNMSIGVGSFWWPVVTPTTWSGWFEHPPLGYGLQAIAFRVFGDGLAVERIYALAMLAGTAAVMIAIWRLVRETETDWAPLLFWILPSTVTWATINNMLENTQTLFTTLAVFLILLAAGETGRRLLLIALAAGLATLAAVLVKGPVGLFPFGAALLTPLLPSRPPVRSAVTIAGVIALVLAIAFAILWSLPAPHTALAGYLDTQLVPALQGRREINGDPLAALRHLGLGVVARMTVIAALFWIFGRSYLRGALQTTPAWFFLAVGLAASLPIAISPKLAGHYFLPSVPFFALGFASLVAGPAKALVSNAGTLTRAGLTTAAIALFAAAAIVPVVHGAIEPRDTLLVESLRAIAPSMPRDVTIGTCEHEATNWRLHGYISRLFRVSLDPAGAPRAGWMLVGESSCTVPPVCSVAAKGAELTLLRCR